MRPCALLGLALILLACRPASREDSNVAYFADDDTAMNGAIAEARRTLPEFKSMLQAPEKRKAFAVKVSFRYDNGQGHEHIWLDQPAFQAGRVSGIVDDEPVRVSSLRRGKRVSAPESAVSDWMVVDNGVLKGGYTIRVEIDRMSPQAKAKALRELGIRPP